MIRRIIAWFPRLCLLFAVTAGGSGCDQAPHLSLSDHMDRAEAARSKGDLKGAVLELKTALRENPDASSARYLLGRTYIKMENGAAAEKEFLEALKLGIDKEALVVPLSQAWLLQAKYDKILKDVRISINLPPAAQASLGAIRGDAFLGLNEVDQAEKAYTRALQADNEAALGYVGLGKVALRRGNLDKARANLAKARENDPDNLKVITLDGDIHSADGKFREAMNAYQKLVKLRPENILYRTVLAWAQVNLGEYEAASKNVDRVLAIVPEYAPANHVKAVAAFETGQYAAARDYENKVLAIYPDRASSLLVFGASNYALGSLEQAYNALRRYVSGVPGDPVGRKLLSHVQIALGRSDEALETLEPLMKDKGGSDTELFGLVAQASLLKGDLATGRNYLERSLEVRPGSGGVMAALGQTEIALGDVDEGLDQMEKAVALKPKDFARRMMLAVEYLRSQKIDKALDTARALQDFAPQKATGHTIEGLALAMKGDKDAAIKAFEKALEVEPGNANAALNLVRYAAADKDWKRVGNLLDGVLAAHPKNLMTLLAYAELVQRKGEPVKARGYLERALNGNPQSREATILLAENYRETGEYLKGLEIARKMRPVFPHDPALLELIGRLEMGAGQTDSATVTFGNLAEVRPESPVSYYLLGLAMELQGNWVAAEKSFNRVLQIDPGDAGARYAKARVLAAEGRLKEADALLDALAKDHPDEPGFLETRGVIAARRGDYNTAIQALKQAFEAQKNSVYARRLAEAYARSGDLKAARGMLDAWLKQYPDDFATRFMLAGEMLAAGDQKAAEGHYRRLLKDQPDNADVLNNLAFLLNRTGRTGEAVTLIERALKKDAENTDILDTAGDIYLTAGRRQDAIAAYRKAVDLAPRNTGLKRRYAAVLIADGRGDAARQVLKELLDSPYPLKDREAVKSLYLKLTAK